MYGFSNQQHYAQSLAPPLAGRKRSRSRSQSQGKRSRSQSKSGRSRSRSQSKSGRSNSQSRKGTRGGNQYSQRRGRGRRGMRAEMQPFYGPQVQPYAGAGMHPYMGAGVQPYAGAGVQPYMGSVGILPYMGPGYALSQPAGFRKGDRQMFVTKKNGIHRVENFDGGKAPKKDRNQKIWNGPAIGPNNKVYIVEDNQIRLPRTKKEKEEAKQYLEHAKNVQHQPGHDEKKHHGKKKEHGDKKQHGDKKHPHKQPTMVHCVYTSLYDTIRKKLKYLKSQSKDANAEYTPPDDLDSIVDQARNLAHDLMLGQNFFHGMKKGMSPGMPLQYLNNEASVLAGEHLPKYLEDFDAVLHSRDNLSGAGKYGAVYEFMSRLQASIRKVVNAQSKYVKSVERRHKFADELAKKFHVSNTDLRGVIQACVNEIVDSNAEGVAAMDLTSSMKNAVTLGFVLHFEGSLEFEKLNYKKFHDFIENNHPQFTHFVESWNKKFKRAVGLARKVLMKRRKVMEHRAKHQASGMPEQAGYQPAAPASAGLTSRLVSMRFD